jgi:heptosyltransferase-2
MNEQPQRILVIQPSWVGDAVMATPTLRALREQYPSAHISYLMKRYVKPIYTGMPWADRLITYRTGKTAKRAGRAGPFRLAARLRRGQFDLAVLLPNSFRTAALAKLARIPRIVGYDRDGRGFLLTDRLIPYRENGRFVPTPIVKSYLGIAQYLGSQSRDVRMQLFVTPAERDEADDVFARVGLPRSLERPFATGQPPLVMLNPGAQYGAAKCWLPEYFAILSDRLVDEWNATVLVSASPRERPIVEAILRHARRPVIDLSAAGTSLGALKEIVRRCDLMITNDTGPRHVAAAMDVPVITLFGPTHPDWTQIYFHRERQVAVKVFCGPCQKKACPLDHRCMTRLTPQMVFQTARELLAVAPGPLAADPGGHVH